MLDKDVANRGVGNVERNTVVSILMKKQVRNFLLQKTTMMPFVVETKRDLSKTTIVGEDVQGIVQNAGKLDIQCGELVSQLSNLLNCPCLECWESTKDTEIGYDLALILCHRFYKLCLIY
jgi:hypothetical protein